MVFSPALFKSNLKRFFYIPLLHFVVMVLAVLFPVYTEMGRRLAFRYGEDMDPLAIAINIRAGIRQSVVLLGIPVYYMIVCALVVLALFSYTYYQKNSYMMHAFPVTRKAMYVTNGITAVLMIVVPNFITTLLTLPMVINLGGAEAAADVFKIFFLGIVSIVFFTGLSMFVAMCTGMMLAMPVLYVILNFLEIAIEAIVKAQAEPFIWGYSMNITNDKFVPVAHATELFLDGIGTYWDNDMVQIRNLIQEPGYYAAMFVLGLVSACLGYVIYKYKQVESAGSLLPMKWTRPIFRIGVAFCAGGVGGLFLGAFVNASIQGVWLLLMIIGFLSFGTLAYFLVEMLIERTARIFTKKTWKEWGIMSGCFVIYSLVLFADVFGVGKRVPDVSEIKSVDLSVEDDFTDYNEEKLGAIIDVHKTIIENEDKIKYQNYDVSSPGYYTWFNVNYDLKNGGELSRSYYISCSEADGEVMEILGKIDDLYNNTEDMMNYLYAKDSYKNVVPDYISLNFDYVIHGDDGNYVYEIIDGLYLSEGTENAKFSDQDIAVDGGEIWLNDENVVKRVLKAVEEDIKAENIKIQPIYSNGGNENADWFGNVDISFTKNRGDGYNYHNAYFRIGRKSENTLNVLKEMGYITSVNGGVSP